MEADHPFETTALVNHPSRLNGRTTAGCLNLLRLYLANSRKETLDIAIYFHPLVHPLSQSNHPPAMAGPGNSRSSRPLMPPLWESLHRIRSLHLEACIS